MAVYVGTLHEERVDVATAGGAGRGPPGSATSRWSDPTASAPAASARLAGVPTIHLLGSQPYDRVPGFLQHADVVIIPHLVNPFTESLDPIKAYECLAAGRPTVATPVAGFRDLGAPVVVGRPGRFVAATSAVCSTAPPAAGTADATRRRANWGQRADAMAAVMQRVRAASEAS